MPLCCAIRLDHVYMFLCEWVKRVDPPPASESSWPDPTATPLDSVAFTWVGWTRQTGLTRLRWMHVNDAGVCPFFKCRPSTAPLIPVNSSAVHIKSTFCTKCLEFYKRSLYAFLGTIKSCDMCKDYQSIPLVLTGGCRLLWASGAKAKASRHLRFVYFYSGL